jgi:hypothetical protein
MKSIFHMLSAWIYMYITHITHKYTPSQTNYMNSFRICTVYQKAPLHQFAI